MPRSPAMKKPMSDAEATVRASVVDGIALTGVHPGPQFDSMINSIVETLFSSGVRWSVRDYADELDAAEEKVRGPEDVEACFLGPLDLSQLCFAHPLTGYPVWLDWVLSGARTPAGRGRQMAKTNGTGEQTSFYTDDDGYRMVYYFDIYQQRRVKSAPDAIRADILATLSDDERKLIDDAIRGNEEHAAKRAELEKAGYRF